MRRIAILLSLSLACAALPAHAALAGPSRATDPGFARLAPGRLVHGFTAVARYRDAAGAPMGARFVHARTGFTLDVLQIQSVPQAFIWVNSWPTSDKGEPHTQEHLLLGKGNRGREVATLDSMSLAETTAYTEQRRTCYQFCTAAGPGVFYSLLEKRLDALLHPDYTDEEIRREVRNFGVADGPDGLRLEEQGTVYNEMTSTYEKPWTIAYHEIARSLYGPAHPLSYESGGSPEALRVLGPADIRKFHDRNYHLANMGMIASLPKRMSLDEALARFDVMLRRLERDGGRHAGPYKRDADLPAPHGAPAGTTQVLGYPDENAQDAGQLLFAWPANIRFADDQERVLADLFANAFAGDATTNLYKRFIDSKTRTLDVGATGVFAGFDDDLGHPFEVGLSDVGAPHLTPAQIGRVRAEIAAELGRIAGYKDGSSELAAFNARVVALLREGRRGLDKLVNTPPGFGFRHTSSGWLTHLDHLAHTPGFDKPVTLGPELAGIEKLVTSKKNIWRDRLAAWHLTGTQPYAIGVKPDPALLQRQRKDRANRLAAETASLVKRYHAKDAQDALRRYKAEYAAHTATLKQLEAASAHRFLAHPPLERDPDLDYRTLKVGPGIPLVASTFDNMTGATTGLALRVDDVPENQLVYLSLLPTLLTEVGVIVDGKPLSHEEVTRRLREEILGLDAYFSRNPRTRRCELVLRGEGNDGAESARAVTWMHRMAASPDWRADNLPRLRDVVDQAAASWHQTMKGAEENWVRDPADAYRWQKDPLQLATGSFLTMEHNAHRLRWRLREIGTGEGKSAFEAYMRALAGAADHASRADLQALTAALEGSDGHAKVPAALQPQVDALAKLPAPQHALAAEAAKDLGMYLSDLPDDSLAGDWRFLCLEMLSDLEVGPTKALVELDQVRRTVLSANKARMFMIGARARQDALLKQSVPALLAGLSKAPAHTVTYPSAPVVSLRLRDRLPGANPLFVGLVDANTQSGVFVNTARGTSYKDTDRDALLKLLSSKLYGGGGAHSIFMKTWAAGLAYSNGLGGSPDTGEVHYYAERCPALPQTLGFVIGELKKAKPDTKLVEYAYAQAFDDSRAARSYESRGEAMAADLADGVTPDTVRRFRRALLTLRGDRHLTSALFKRMPAVYGTVLPGLDGKVDGVTDASYFVIGPEKQLQGYEGYLKKVEGPAAKLYRLYPRDFWLVDPVASTTSRATP